MKALILIDLQNDFCPGGALAVPRGDEVIPSTNRLMPRFDLVVATKDWHPPEHKSFASNHSGKRPGEVVALGGWPQILWPNHCVQNTSGAEFHPELNSNRIAKVFLKGTDPEVDSYSAFFDNRHLQATGLGDYLKEKGVDEVYLLGLATEYCVKYSALDAAELGFKTFVIADACRGMERSPGDVADAFREMERAGAQKLSSEEILSA